MLTVIIELAFTDLALDTAWFWHQDIRLGLVSYLASSNFCFLDFVPKLLQLIQGSDFVLDQLFGLNKSRSEVPFVSVVDGIQFIALLVFLFESILIAGGRLALGLGSLRHEVNDDGFVITIFR